MARAVPRRIHVLIDSLNWGGAEALLGDFAAAAQGRGTEVSVAHLSDRPGTANRLRELGIEPELLNVQGLLSAANRRAVRRHLAAVDPDVLHTHLGYSDVYGGLAARSLGIPSVSTLHTMDAPEELREKLKMRLMAMVRRRCAYRVIAVSDALRQHYLVTGWDHPERVVTVRNGIVGRVHAGAGVGVREQLGIAADSFVVAMVSVLRHGKGHSVARQAIESLGDRIPGLHLLVLGAGPDEDEISRDLSSLGGALTMAGHRDDVLAVLDAVDVLVHPSQVDALPTALMEAMAARVPVVASRVGGIPEIVIENETGLLIDAPPQAPMLAAAVERLAADRELRARFGEAGRRRFEAEFSAESWMDRLMPIYCEAVRSQAEDREIASGSGRDRLRDVAG